MSTEIESEKPKFDMAAYQSAYAALKNSVYKIFMIGQKADLPELKTFLKKIRVMNPKALEELNTNFDNYNKLRRKQ